MIALYIWLVFVLGIIYIGLSRFRTSVLKSISGISAYSSAIEIHKKGFERSHFPIIKAVIRGKSRYFLVDTGANHNMIDLGEYTKIIGDSEIDVKGSMNMVGIGSTADAPPIKYNCIEDTVIIGPNEYNVSFAIGDSWETAKDAVANQSGLPLIGIIGSEFIDSAGWVIDYSNLMIWVKDSAYGVGRA